MTFGEPERSFEEPEPPGPEMPSWIGASLAEAEFTMRRCRRLSKNLREIADAAAELVAEALAWAENERGPLVDDLAAAEHWLASWFEARRELEGPKAPAEVRLPSGVIKSRKGSLVLEVDDEEAFVEWAKAQGHDVLLRFPPPVQPPPSIDKAVVKAAAQGTGPAGAMIASGGADLDEPGEIPLIDPETGQVVPGAMLVRKPREVKVQPGPSSLAGAESQG